MRVTAGMLSGTLLTDLQNTQEALLRDQSMLASGKKLQRPSDNPGGIDVALRLQGQLNDMKQYQANISAGQAWLQSSDTALANATGVLQQVRTLVVSATSGTVPQSARNDAASQVQQLQQSLLGAANAQYDGYYLFAGDQTQQPAFTPAGVYQGDAGQRRYEIGPGADVTVNVTGAAAFGNLFKTLGNIVTDLQAGNTSSLSNTDLPALDAGMNQLLDQRAVGGAALQRLTSANTQLMSLQTATDQILSSITDANVAKTIVGYQQQQQSYQLALAAGANLIQQSLLDFLK